MKHCWRNHATQRYRLGLPQTWNSLSSFGICFYSWTFLYSFLIHFLCNTQNTCWRPGIFLLLTPNSPTLLTEDDLVLYHIKKTEATKCTFFHCEPLILAFLCRFTHSLPLFSWQKQLACTFPNVTLCLCPGCRHYIFPACCSIHCLVLSASFCPYVHLSFCNGYVLSARELSSILKHIIQTIPWCHIKWTFNVSLSLVSTKASWATRVLQSSDTKASMIPSQPLPPYFSKDYSTLSHLPVFSLITCKMASRELYWKVWHDGTTFIAKSETLPLLRGLQNPPTPHCLPGSSSPLSGHHYSPLKP